MQQILTTCPFCGVGCGIYLEAEVDRVLGAYPSVTHPANRGRICLRGWHVHELCITPARLRKPLLRKNGQLEEVEWEEAIRFVSERLESIRSRYGPAALAFLAGPRCTNEDAYILQKVARVVFGTNNVDHGYGAYTNTALEVLLRSLKVPASPAVIEDVGEADLLFIDQVDLSRQNPTVGGWVIRARESGTKVVAVSYRRDRITLQADIQLYPQPGTALWLYGAIAKVLWDRGFIDLEFLQKYCINADEVLRSVQQYDLLRAAEICDVPPQLIEEAATAYGKAKSALILCSTGGEARDPLDLHAVVNLALMRGHLGRKGAGLLVLTEHCNLQGVCDMGVLPGYLPGYTSVFEDEAMDRFQTLWGVRPPKKAGVTATDVFAGANSSGIRACWLMRFDPLILAGFSRAFEALRRMELLVVQEAFLSPIGKYAHVVFPLPAFGEEDGTYTSTERRVQRVRPVVFTSSVMPGWQLLTELAKRFGHRWAYSKPADVMEEIRQAVPFYSGIGYESLEHSFGRQWPCTQDRPGGTTRLFEDGLRERQFVMTPIKVPSIPAHPGPEYPFRLVFGQSLYFWHRDTYVNNSQVLLREHRVLLLDYPDGFVEINPTDAERLNIRDGRAIKISSPLQSVVTTARVTDEVRPGTVHVPFFVREVAEALWINGAEEIGTLSKPVFVKVEPCAE